MGAVGTPQPVAKWAARLVFLIVIGAFILILGQRPLLKWRERDSMKVQKQREWICQTVAGLRQIEPPSDDPGQGYYPWITSNYLIFSNGWAAYKTHTHHSDRLIGDIALLRLSDGRIFSSRHHYSGSVSRLMTVIEGEVPQPTDAEDFLNNRAKRQQWNLLSPDGRVICAVFCSGWRNSKEALWVSIGNCDGSSATNFFVRRYAFSGNYLGWTTHWNSDNNLTVDVFDYVQHPLTEYPEGRDVPTKYLATLKFHRDRQTGGFTEEKP